MSTYNYAENSPIANIDLWGLQAFEHNMARRLKQHRTPSKQAANDWMGPAIGYTLGGLALAGGGSAAIGQWGLRAVGGFIANEIKDEALSQATGGATDILDATKMGAKLIKEGSSTLFRAVSGDELNDISDSGLIRSGPNSMETKLFTENVDDAVFQGTETGKDFSIISVEVPNSTLDKLGVNTTIDKHVGGMTGNTIFVDPDKLDLFNTTRGKVSTVNN